jgi:hypothetical protein
MKRDRWLEQHGWYRMEADQRTLEDLRLELAEIRAELDRLIAEFDRFLNEIDSFVDHLVLRARINAYRMSDQ